jgi:hypothetical protein
MLNRIPMDIIHVPVKVFIVTDHVLPKAALPNAAFAPFGATLRNPFVFFESSGKPAFDQTPTGRKIRVSGRKRPDAMKVVRQNDNRFKVERMPKSDVSKRGPQEINALNQQSISPAFGKIDREKPCSSRQPSSTVFSHRGASWQDFCATDAVHFVHHILQS